MTTRHAEPGSPFHQERYASSSGFDRGLLANLVAKRCSVLDDRAERELIWHLQAMSWREGGLAKFTKDLLARFPERIATETMQKLKLKPGRECNANEVRAIRNEIEPEHGKFLLKGEMDRRQREASERLDFRIEDLLDRGDGDSAFQQGRLELEREINARPKSYPAQAFFDACREGAEMYLEQYLVELCSDPLSRPQEDADVTWYFPTLISTLNELRALQTAESRARVVVTEIGRRVEETLDYALQQRCLVLIEGIERIGKTYAAKKWCEQRPGQVRFAQVPSTSSEIEFYRAIASALGVSTHQNAKAHHLRARIEEALQCGDLMLVLDEAHYLWPQSTYHDALPGRVNWLMTALVNYEVPVALLCTPQFFARQRALKKKTGWRDGQFIGRLGHFESLPDSLSETDLMAVAKSLLPHGDKKSIQILVAYSQTSARYLAGIETAVKRASFLARRAGRDRATFSDLQEAIKTSAMPADEALAAATSEPARPLPAKSRRADLPPARSTTAAVTPVAPHPFARNITPAIEPVTP